MIKENFSFQKFLAPSLAWRLERRLNNIKGNDFKGKCLIY